MKKLLLCDCCFAEFDSTKAKVKSGYCISKVKCSNCGKNIKKNENLNCVDFSNKESNWTIYLISESRVESRYGHSTIHGPSKRELRLQEVKQKNKYFGYNYQRSRFFY